LRRQLGVVPPEARVDQQEIAQPTLDLEAPRRAGDARCSAAPLAGLGQRTNEPTLGAAARRGGQR
jgi:hypothetical protein